MFDHAAKRRHRATLGHWFGVEPQFWLNLQAQYDLVQADRETGARIHHLPTSAGVLGKGVAPGIA